MTDATSERAVFVISVAAELAGVHPQTLRIYERKGLLHPKRNEANNRRYSERDIAKLREIQELTSKGVNLAGVRRVLALEAEVDRLRRRVAELGHQLAADRARHQAELDRQRRSMLRELVLAPGRAELAQYEAPASGPGTMQPTEQRWT